LNCGFRLKRNATSTTSCNTPLKTWGNDHALTYYTLLWDAFRRIQAFPKIGRQVSADRPDVRELILEYHTIVYRYRADSVTIFRIVNPRRRRR
jgi:plasmid stabilization system protein ParE